MRTYAGFISTVIELHERGRIDAKSAKRVLIAAEIIFAKKLPDDEHEDALVALLLANMPPIPRPVTDTNANQCT